MVVFCLKTVKYCGIIINITTIICGYNQEYEDIGNLFNELQKVQHKVYIEDFTKLAG